MSGIRIIVAATAVLLATALPAHADCGDPGEPTCTGPVPTTDEVLGDLARLTDPGVPAADKADIVTPGFSPEEAQTIDDHLNRLNTRGYVPFTFIVTDIQSAPADYAGTTVSIPSRPWTPPGPVVLVKQGDRWAITHDTAMTLLNAIWHNTHQRGGPPSFSPSYTPPLVTFGI